MIGPCISRHFNNKKPGCLDATIKIGIPVTIYRFWVMNGKYHAIIVEGEYRISSIRERTSFLKILVRLIIESGFYFMNGILVN